MFPPSLGRGLEDGYHSSGVFIQHADAATDQVLPLGHLPRSGYLTTGTRVTVMSNVPPPVDNNIGDRG